MLPLGGIIFLLLHNLTTLLIRLDFTRRVLAVRVAHKGNREERGHPLCQSPTWSS